MDLSKDQFFGRERVLREIVAGVLAPSQPASFSLVGSKLVGKSRLLGHLASPDGPLMGSAWESWRPYRHQDGDRVVVVLVDCDVQEAQDDLLGTVADRVTQQLQADRIQLDWGAVDQQPGASRRLWQMSHQLNAMDYRLVLLMDNFDTVFENQLLTPESVDELRPLTRELALVVATEQPLHDLDRELAASPLFNVMTQLFLGIIEPEAARRWLEAYGALYPAVDAIANELLKLTGSHPFLLLRIGDILAEVQLVLPPGQTLGPEHLPLIRLRLAEHGRLLFVTLWRNLQNPPPRIDPQILMGLLKRLVAHDLPFDQVAREVIPTLNWLINQAMVICDVKGYALFSPLFTEFLANRMEAMPVRAATPVPAISHRPAPLPIPDAPIYAELTKTEGALLRYFQMHPHEVVSPEELLLAVWKRPDASARRVQEAIRRLRLQLEEASPPVGTIENERGQGYRFVPVSAQG
ncbi:MAG: helix-turn-helix domain-containing protein [Caldilineaceae bacterium]|nr:helix-turn-helix domain-containing protein [Caldilineaceae bacterium]